MSDSFATTWTIALQAPLSVGFSRQEYWSRLPFPFPEDLPNPGIEPTSPACNTGGLGLIPGSGRFPWRRKWQPTPVFLHGESHGQRSLVGYSPWGRKELNMTQQLNNNKNFINTDTDAKRIDKYECDMWRNRSYTFDSKI